MTLERDVIERLHAAAASLEVGEPPVGAIRRRAGRRGKLRTMGVAASVVVGLGVSAGLGYIVTGGGMQSGSAPPVEDSGAFTPRAGRAETSEAPAGQPGEITDQTGSEVSGDPVFSQDFTLTEGTSQGTPTSGGGGAPAPAPAGAAGGSEADAAPLPAGPAIGERVVKTADIQIEVSRKGFAQAYARAQTAAADLGGYVASASSGGKKRRSAQVVIRIPSGRFERALVALKELGTIRGETVTGENVSGKFVDLGARLTSWRAQERSLRRLMDHTTSIDEGIKVQKELQKVRTEIESIEGQLRVLRDQSALGTITVSLAEPKVIAKPKEREEQPGTLTRAWNLMVQGAENVLAWTLVGLGYLVPAALILLLLWLAFRAIRARVPA